MKHAPVPPEVRAVCRDHYDNGPEIQSIFWFPYDGGGPVRLLEIDELTMPGDAVWQITFNKLDEYPAISIAVVTPDEWQRVKDGEEGWSLPDGWDLGQAVEIPREDVVAEPKG